MSYTVSQVSKLARVSVRALHHYDAIGLLTPSGRSDAGYRHYSDGDLQTLQEVLFFRELGMGLEDIRDMLAQPGYDRTAALIVQRELLAEKAHHVESMIDLIDRTLAAEEKGIAMTKEEMFEVFGDFDPSEYEDEVKERWGDTDAYKESARRTKRYTKADWERIKGEGAANMERMLELFDAGVEPTDVRAMDVADEARLQIDRDFYPCSREMHVNLGEMYVADSRFTEYYDKHRTGLAVWFRDAIRANAARSEG